MQEVSAEYNQIIEGQHWFESQLEIVGVGTFDESYLFSMSTETNMFMNAPEVGKAVAGEINVKMKKIPQTIPTMATLRPYVRACNEGMVSEWVPQGVYFIDTREESKNDDGLDVLVLHGFDAMLKAEQSYTDRGVIDWSSGRATDVQMVQDIAALMGVYVDDRTWDIMTNGYTVPIPTGYSLREYLCFIASMYAGCFVITENGRLRLVTIYEIPLETNYLIDSLGYQLVFGEDRILV